MSFKLLMKQASRNLTSKVRLYLSLVIFLIIGFSIISGAGTYFQSWHNDFMTIMRDGNSENFEVSSFKFANSKIDEKDISPNVMIKFSKTGEDDFYKYLAREITDYNKATKNNDEQNVDNEIENLKKDNFINSLGKVNGDLNTIAPVGITDEQKAQFQKDVDALMDISQYYGNNVMFMYLSDSALPNNLHEEKVLSSILNTVTGRDGKYTNVTAKIRAIPTDKDYIDQNGFRYPSPYVQNGLNKLTFYDDAKIQTGSDYKNLMPFYVSPNYLRFTKTKIGDKMSVIVNNASYKGYIVGTASDKYDIFYPDQTGGVYVNPNDLGAMTNNKYVIPNSLNGYIEIPGSSNSFDNNDEFKIAYQKINEALLNKDLKLNDSTNKIFNITNSNKTDIEIADLLEDKSNPYVNYHVPVDLYSAFSLVVEIVLAVLIVIVAYFIIDESIKSDKKTLWFLKAIGERDSKLSLVNTMTILLPLLFALVITIPGTMLMMQFLTTAITTSYSFTIPFYQLTWVTAVVLGCSLIGTLLIFLVINLFSIKGGALSLQTNDSMSKFQIFLSKISEPMLQKAPGTFRVGFAFVRQNLIKNLVSFVLFTILFTVTLFGVQFNRAIDNQKNSYQDWMGDYHAISTLSPKQVVTQDTQGINTNVINSFAKDSKQFVPTYQTLNYDQYTKLLKESNQENGALKGGKEDYDFFTNTGSSIIEKGKIKPFDLVSFVNYTLLDGADKATANETEFTKAMQDPSKLIIDSSTETVVKLPTDYRSLAAHISAAFVPDKFDQSGSCTYTNDSNKTVTVTIDQMNIALNDRVDLNRAKTINPQATIPGSMAQWALREINNISLWKFDGSYMVSMEKLLPDSAKDNIQTITNVIEGLVPPTIKPVVQTLMQVIQAQTDIFGVKNPEVSVGFGNIIKPEKGNALSATAFSSVYKNNSFMSYGLDPDNQPFTEPISGLDQRYNDKDSLIKNKSSDSEQNIAGFIDKSGGKSNEYKGVTYWTIPAMFSSLAKDRYSFKVGDVIPIDLNESGLNTNIQLAFKVSGFVPNDSVILEGFYNRAAIYEFYDQVFSADGNTVPSLEDINNPDGLNFDNTMYTQEDVPYFLQNVTVPHMLGTGSCIDDYIYKLDTFTSSHLTTKVLTKTFADTVDSYSTLMTCVIILLVVLCFSLSMIIITLIMFENKKTILLFKAMGYKKREVIWYIVSGYLIAAIIALGLSFGLTVMFVHVLAPMAASGIFLHLSFSPFWLFWVIGFFETGAFMALVVGSIVTYTRVLKPKDAFATL